MNTNSSANGNNNSDKIKLNDALLLKTCDIMSEYLPYVLRKIS